MRLTFQFSDRDWQNLSSKYNLRDAFRICLQNIGDQYHVIMSAEQARPRPSEVKERLQAVEELAKRLIQAFERLDVHAIDALTVSAEDDRLPTSVTGPIKLRSLEALSASFCSVRSLLARCQTASGDLVNSRPGAYVKADLIRFLVLSFLLAYEAECAVIFTGTQRERRFLGDYVELVDSRISQRSLEGAVHHVCEVEQSFPKLIPKKDIDFGNL